MDQLIIFMALAKGKSRVLAPKHSSITSLHLETAIHFITLLIGTEFKVTNNNDGTQWVECEEMGYQSK